MIIFPGLHEEVDYSEKLKFSDDEEDHSPSDKSKIWCVSASFRHTFRINYYCLGVLVIYRLAVFRGEWESRRERQSSLSSDGQEDAYHHQHDPLPSRKTNSRYSSTDGQVIKARILIYRKVSILSETLSSYLFIFP